MPVEIASPIRQVNQDEFHQIDRLVMKLAFEIHHEFGRLLDEEITKQN